MDLTIRPSTLSGEITIPPSKSHTIRALLIATFAKGKSKIKNPLFSQDTYSCIEACKAFGGNIAIENDTIYVTGNGGIIPNRDITIDVGNSGTTLYLAIAMAALGTSPITFIGDNQIKKRSALPLLKALESLGAKISSDNGCTPITVKGPLKGGCCSLFSPTSQYLSALLLALPLSKNKCNIKVLELNEKPYVNMTIQWLSYQPVKIKQKGFSSFSIYPTSISHYNPIDTTIAGDYSSASFFIVAGALVGTPLTIKGLQKKDSQGDKAIIDILKKMGANIKWVYSKTEELLVVAPPKSSFLRAIKIDLNNMPDALPILSVAAAFANGTTRIYNVAHARLKETDRITCMAQELSKVGVPIFQRPDGLVIEGLSCSSNGISNLELPIDPFAEAVTVKGHDDHRIIMALAIAATAGNYPLLICGCEGAQITYPDFFDTLKNAGEADKNEK